MIYKVEAQIRSVKNVSKAGGGVYSNWMLITFRDNLNGSLEREMWGATKLRKNTRCASCGRELLSSQVAWRPNTNKFYRGYRFCNKCVEDNLLKADEE